MGYRVRPCFKEKEEQKKNILNKIKANLHNCYNIILNSEVLKHRKQMKNAYYSSFCTPQCKEIISCEAKF